MNNPSNDAFAQLLTRFATDEQFRGELGRGGDDLRAGLSEKEGQQLDQILATYAQNRSILEGLAFPLNTGLGTYLTARR